MSCEGGGDEQLLTFLWYRVLLISETSFGDLFLKHADKGIILYLISEDSRTAPPTPTDCKFQV